MTYIAKSSQTAYNLGWKLGHVIKGQAKRSLLETYVSERRQIAEELIAFDHRLSRLFSGRPSKDLLDKEGIDLKTFQGVLEKGNLFASGVAVDYPRNLIVAKDPNFEIVAPVYEVSHDEAFVKSQNENALSATMGKQHLATGIPIGMRIPSFKVLNQSDARPWHLQGERNILRAQNFPFQPFHEFSQCFQNFLAGETFIPDASREI